MPRGGRDRGSAPGVASLRDRALRLLGRREHSRAELVSKLSVHGYAREEIGVVIDSLEQSDLQSDTRYAASQVRARGGREGNRLLRQRLGRQGVGDDLVDEALGQLPVEKDRLYHILSRDADLLDDPAFRRRLVNRCLRRGFSWDEVRAALRAIAAGDEPPAARE